VPRAIFRGVDLYPAALPTAEVRDKPRCGDVCLPFIFGLLSMLQSLNKASKNTYNWMTAHPLFHLRQVDHAVSVPGIPGCVHESLLNCGVAKDFVIEEARADSLCKWTRRNAGFDRPSWYWSKVLCWYQAMLGSAPISSHCLSVHLLLALNSSSYLLRNSVF
jgi:hypothetical protein